MLYDLITRPHKTESKKFLCFWRSIIVIFLFILILFFMALIMKLIDEKPYISSTFIPIDSLLIPGKNGFLKKNHKNQFFLISKLRI